jgi:N-acyl-D-amino-acid deacylase
MELVFENAQIVDGTGSPWFRGSVAVQDGEIADVSRRSDHGFDAVETIDVGGDVVCPGFIDTHPHSDLELFNDPTLEPKIRQGITTEVMGQDGYSMAPVPGDGIDPWQQQIRGLDGELEDEWTWMDVAGYLDAVEENGCATNVATLVGHGNVRYHVLGMDERTPTEDELTEMGDLVTEALDQGAVGLSTGLVYFPHMHADTHEVEALAERLAPYGRPFVAHIRSQGRWIWEALDEFIDVGADVDVPIHLSHFVMMGAEQHGKASRGLGIIESARERGIDMTVDQHPYTAGSTMLLNAIPPWAKSGGSERILERLEDPDARERIRRDIEEWRIDGWENVGDLCGWDNIYVADLGTEENAHLQGRSIAEGARKRGEHPIAFVCDLLVEEELKVNVTFRNFYRESDVREILAHEFVNVITDGVFGESPHPRLYGTYPRVLGKYVREENLLSVEDAVRKMTALPARAMGLQDKGIVRPGMDADLVVFDPDVVEARATYERPRQFPRGIRHVVVNGEFVVRDESVTGECPGEAIRS